MIFQTLDDKSECVGVYVDGKLHFEEVPNGEMSRFYMHGSTPEARTFRRHARNTSKKN
jgi:hypothetical protein